VQIAPEIRLCQVDIQVLARDWWGDFLLADLRRPARGLSPAAPIDAWLAPVEQKVLERFKSFKRQVEWLAGRLAVKTLAGACLDPDLPPTAVTVSHEPDGAPVLPAFPRRCISITHGGRFAVAALSLDPAQAIGIDIERMPLPAGEAFLRLAFSQRERAVLDPVDQLALARAWTLKEAYLKYIRRGFHRNLQGVEFLDGKLLDGGREAPVRWTFGAPDPDHLLAVLFGPR
jgi:4'-phosphopantetheinyl transferase